MGDLDVRSHYDELSAIYDRDRNQEFVDKSLAAYRAAIAGHERRVLEVGCGTGAHLAGLFKAGLDVYGVDYSPRMCEVARARLAAAGATDADTRIRAADVEDSLDFDGSFSAMVLMDSWESFPKPEKALQVIHGSLEPGGRLVIFTPNPTFRWLLTFLEATGIKKLKPAFCFGNSSPRRIAALVDGLFRLRDRRTLFFGLEQRFILERLP